VSEEATATAVEPFSSKLDETRLISDQRNLAWSILQAQWMLSAQEDIMSHDIGKTFLGIM
jgi:hypothetical protein